jgi:cell division protein FtsB
MGSHRRLLRWAVCTAAVLVLVSLVDARGFRRYFRLQRQIASLSERNRQLAEHNDSLRREVEALRADPQTLEQAAREELLFIKPDEVVVNLE